MSQHNNWRRSKSPFSLRQSSNPLPILMIPLIFAALLSACGEQGPPSTPDYFIPPTLSKDPTPITLATPTPIIPTPTTPCTNDLTFLEDVTIPDGTAFAPGKIIEKIWRVINAGSCNWDEDYRVRFLDGDAMGAELQQALFPARSASDAQLSITFTVPDTPGIVTSAWQAYSPEGEPFGDIFFIQIEVDPDLIPTQTPTKLPTEIPTPTPTPSE